MLKHSQIFLRSSTLNRPLKLVSDCSFRCSQVPIVFQSTRSNEAVFIEKVLEVPIIVVNEGKSVDMIGPPDPISNLRPIIRKEHLNQTYLQEKLRILQDETHAWNQRFWAEHNTRFIKEKNEYVKKLRNNCEDNIALTADEMSEFYKMFLDKNWSFHIKYNKEWYKRNFSLLFLSLMASLPQSLHFVFRNY